MPYPPVVQKGSSFAQTTVAGEYLQRLCSGYLSRVRGDAQDEEVKKQAAMMLAYDDKEAAPQKSEGAPVPVVVPSSAPAEEPSHPQESSAAVPVSMSTDTMVPPTLPPATGVGAAASATAAAGVAVTALQPAMSVPTVAPLKPAPEATLAPVPTVAPVVPVATVAPAVPLKPQLLPVTSGGPLRFREQGNGAEPVAQSGSPAAELQGDQGRSISDWLVVSMGVFGLVMVCVAAHFLRSNASRRKGPVSESDMSDQESFLPN